MSAQLAEVGHEEWLNEYRTEFNRYNNFQRKEIGTMGRFTQETGGKQYAQAPAGNHIARCIKITDLGTQHGEYQGEPTVRNQVMLTWELSGEMMEDGRPFTVSSFLTNSLNEKAKLRAFLISWRGRDFSSEELKKFDLQSVLGAPCMVNVIENDKGKATVAGVSKMPKGVAAADPVNAPSAFWISEWDDDAFAAISPGIQRIIQASDEFKRRGAKGLKSNEPGLEEKETEDVPF